MKLDALILSLPARNSTVRMRMWRALKDAGCGVLRDGVYVLPAGSHASAVFAPIESDIRAAGGFAMRAEINVPSEEEAPRLRSLFDRTEEYGMLAERIGRTKAALPGLGKRKAATAVARLRRAYDRLTRIDFFPGHAQAQAAAALADLADRLRALQDGGEPRAGRKRLRRVDARRYRRRTWATREQPWVDRLASAWLIKRFIDRDARFVWIRHPRECPRNAVGFDYNGAPFTHAGHRVTFEVLLSSFGLDADPGLAAIAAAVHYLDVGGIPVADASGLETLLKGSREKARDDDALLADAMRILDLLYAAYSRNEARNPAG